MLLTASFSFACQNQPGRMETSTSLGYQCRKGAPVILSRLPRSDAGHVRPVKLLRVRRERDNAPFAGAPVPRFVPAPADIGAFAKDDGLAVGVANERIPVLVGVALARAGLRIRAIEPDFADLARIR